MKVSIKSEQSLKDLAQRLGSELKAGDILALTGDLGAGKTTMTKAIAVGMGIEEHVTSPTFTIVNEYEGSPGLFHFDVYRISDTSEMEDIGYEEYFYSRAKTVNAYSKGYASVVEWANLIEELMPEETLWLELTLDETDLNARHLLLREGQLHSLAGVWQARIERIVSDWYSEEVNHADNDME